MWYSDLPQSLDIWQNGDEGISDFRISGQSFVNENCHKSRTSHDIDMKPGPVTKIDKCKAVTSKKLNGDIMSTNCGAIVFNPIYGHFVAIPKPDSGRIVYKTYIFINSNLLFYKNWFLSDENWFE